MKYAKYQHVERLGCDEVDGILIGSVCVFPKIDGTNAHIWINTPTEIRYGSRNKELSYDNDNAGFMKWASENNAIKLFMQHLYGIYGQAHVYGEWLVPHTLKTYREDTWRNFYIFDVRLEDGSYLDYEKYLSYAHDYEIEVIPPTRVILNPTVEDVLKVIDKNTYLIKDGEGVVLKNYSFVNKYGKTIWAKVVRNEFKDQNAKAFGIKESKGTDMIEEKIVSNMFSKELIDKVIANIKNECGWNSKSIPRLIETVWHDFVIENIWDIVKKHKTPTINFKLLKQFVVQKIKETVPELF